MKMVSKEAKATTFMCQERLNACLKQHIVNLSESIFRIIKNARKKMQKREIINNMHNIIFMKYADFYVYRKMARNVKHAILFLNAKCGPQTKNYMSMSICIGICVCCHYRLRPGIWCVGGVKTLKDLEKHSPITKVWSLCCDVGR